MNTPHTNDTPRNRIAILGSTGSIGTQALEVIALHEEYFEVEVLTANRNAELLTQQAVRFKPNAVVIADRDQASAVKAALEPLHIKVYSGEAAVASIVEMETIDLVLTALVGYSGLLPTIRAIEAGKSIALAKRHWLWRVTSLPDWHARRELIFSPSTQSIQQYSNALPASFITALKRSSLPLRVVLFEVRRGKNWQASPVLKR
jgi:hypothetical protein